MFRGFRGRRIGLPQRNRPWHRYSRIAVPLPDASRASLSAEAGKRVGSSAEAALVFSAFGTAPQAGQGRTDGNSSLIAAPARPARMNSSS